MTDVKIVRSGELMVAGVDGLTKAGAEFVDSYFPARRDAPMTVVDAGRIVLQEQDIADFVDVCEGAGLTVEQEEGI